MIAPAQTPYKATKDAARSHTTPVVSALVAAVVRIVAVAGPLLSSTLEDEAGGGGTGSYQVIHPAPRSLLLRSLHHRAPRLGLVSVTACGRRSRGRREDTRLWDVESPLSGPQKGGAAPCCTRPPPRHV